MPIISKILTPSLNTNDVNNYFPSASGQRFCHDEGIKGLLPLAPSGTFQDSKVGPAPPSIFWRSRNVFSLAIFALVPTTPMLSETTWRAVEGDGELYGLQYLTNLISNGELRRGRFPIGFSHVGWC